MGGGGQWRKTKEVEKSIIHVGGGVECSGNCDKTFMDGP